MTTSSEHLHTSTSTHLSALVAVLHERRGAPRAQRTTGDTPRVPTQHRAPVAELLQRARAEVRAGALEEARA